METVTALEPVRFQEPAFAPEIWRRLRPCLVNAPEPVITPLRVWGLFVVPESALAVIVRETSEPVLQTTGPESVRDPAPLLPIVRLVFVLARLIALVAVNVALELIEAEVPLTFNVPTPKPAALPRISPPP